MSGFRLTFTLRAALLTLALLGCSDDEDGGSAGKTDAGIDAPAACQPSDCKATRPSLRCDAGVPELSCIRGVTGFCEWGSPRCTGVAPDVGPFEGGSGDASPDADGGADSDNPMYDGAGADGAEPADAPDSGTDAPVTD